MVINEQIEEEDHSAEELSKGRSSSSLKSEQVDFVGYQIEDEKVKKKFLQ